MITIINSIQMRNQINSNSLNSKKCTEIKNSYVGSKNLSIPKNLSSIYFTGSVSHEINSARKWIDYGDIFKSGAQIISAKKPKAKKQFADLVGSNLGNSDFSKSAFVRAKFSGANLKGTKLSSSNLHYADFQGVKTEETDFTNANLSGANFQKTIFGPRTIMQGANVIGADFRGCEMTKLNLVDAIYNPTTKFPEEFNPSSKKMLLLKEGADFSNLEKKLERVKLRYVDFKDIDFRNTSLKRADLKHAYFENCKMQKTNLTRTYAKEATFKNTDLRGSDLKQINLDKSKLENVNLQQVNLRGAILTWESASNLKLDGAVYDQHTKFNAGFDPKKNNMICQESNTAYYGSK